jgi:prepilin-type N-terminal cleavage/methylation domain-containing protein
MKCRRNDNRSRHRSGFTLIEIMVVVAILAILSAALTPLVIKYVNDGRRARTLSDSQSIGQAILAFNLDTGLWPVNSDTIVSDAGELSRLVGLPDGFAATSIPAGAGTATGDGNWDGGGSGGVAGSIDDHLIFNRNATVNPLYPASASPPEPPGWNGPYLKSVPTDLEPSYVCNLRYLKGERDGHDAGDEESACGSPVGGPNGLYETSFDDATELENQAGGDDIGWLIEGTATASTAAPAPRRRGAVHRRLFGP